MNLETQQCPNCGAPLKMDANTVSTACVYCNTPILVTRDAAGHQTLAKDAELDEATVETIKQLLFTGRKEDALAAYSRAKPSATPEDAQLAIDGYARNIQAEAINRATMSTRGWVFTGIETLAFAGGIYLLPKGPGFAVAGGVICVITGFLLVVSVPIALRTIRYRSASVGEAVVLHQAHVASLGRVHTYRMHLRITEKNGNTFETDLAMPVKSERREKIFDGARMSVRYFPGDPRSVIYHGEVAN